MLQIKRVYEQREKSDGYRVFIDRLWPRGISKEAAHFDLWLKEIAPSNELRKWFDHDSKKWPAFQKKYRAEIAENDEHYKALAAIVKKEKTVTLLYSAKDEEHNNAVVLLDLLKSKK